ncbi:MAG: anion transporter, partial [Bacillota bacterium]|nr:anion transporter [Bacillota bacterium]
ILAVLTSFITRTNLKAIDMKVIASLFSLMLISQAFEKYQLLNYISTTILSKVNSQRKIGILLIFVTAVLGSFITNDVALITIVPITIGIGKKAGFDPYKIIVFETIAANIGSSLTPFGNPQNLYLYSRYRISLSLFFSVIGPIIALGIFILFILSLSLNNKSININVQIIKISSNKKVSMYIILFIFMLLSILRVLDYRIITIFVFINVLYFDKDLFKSVDYYLLGTFIGFFIFVDHLNQMIFIKYIAEKFLGSPKQVFLASTALSQIISNVPTAILMSTFVNVPDMILLGVTVGGLGTLIASLANLISYKFYIKEYENSTYLKFFYKINIIILLILTIFIIFLY